MKILYVEDNKINQRIVSLFLKKHNHEIILANDGIEAIEKFVENDMMTNIEIYPSDVKKGNIRKEFNKIIWFNR